jgi:hypothetical protein
MALSYRKVEIEKMFHPRIVFWVIRSFRVCCSSFHLIKRTVSQKVATFEKFFLRLFAPTVHPKSAIAV